MSSGGNEGTRAAAHLFEFLREVQRLRVRSIQGLQAYRSAGGDYYDLGSWPREHGLKVPCLEGDGTEAPIAVVPRIQSKAAPEPDAVLKPWIVGDYAKPSTQVTLAPTLLAPHSPDPNSSEVSVVEQELDDHPDVKLMFDQWYARWRVWASSEQSTKPIRDIYKRLFVTRETVQAASQEWEVVLGVGRLRWHDSVDRPLLVQGVRIDLDEESGDLVVTAEDPLAVELDMIDPTEWPTAEARAVIGDGLDLYLDVEFATERLTAFMNMFSSAGAVGERPADRTAPWIELSPTLILRRRSAQGLVEALDAIVQYLINADEVPEGLLSLIDPDEVTLGQLGEPSEDGAVFWDEDEYFLPLPVNERQFEVIRRVDHRSLTLVQGPPGTGKTHTTAALISHLLAQGKRVLVTAQTEQALREVRDKLPAAVQDLAVPVLGTGQEERNLLSRSVSVLSERASSGAPSGERQLSSLRAQLADAKSQRAAMHNRLIELRRTEVEPSTVGPYSGTRSGIADQVLTQSPEFDWILALTTQTLGETSPLRDVEWLRLVHLLRRSDIDEYALDYAQPLPDIAMCPSVAAMEETWAAIERSQAVVADYALAGQSEAASVLRGRSDAEVESIEATAQRLGRQLSALRGRREPWVAHYLDDLVARKGAAWVARRDNVFTQLSEADRLLVVVGDEHKIVINGDAMQARTMARAAREHLAQGGTIKTDALARPRLGMFSSKLLKSCQPLFENCLVDGSPPTDEDALERVVAWVDLSDQLHGLDAAWPDTTASKEDTLAERTAWHRAELEILVQALEFGDSFVALQQSLESMGLVDSAWDSSDDLEDLSRAAQCVLAERSLEGRRKPLDQLSEALSALDSSRAPAPLARRLTMAIVKHERETYIHELQRLAELLQLKAYQAEREHLSSLAQSGAPLILNALKQTPQAAEWDHRLEHVDEAWAWRRARTWLSDTQPENVNRLQSSLRDIEDEVRALVGEISAELAWSKAVGRLKPSQVTDLVQYTQLVRKLGKGTGKYAARQRQQIRDVLQRCVNSVPVWIVPLHRVATQFSMTPGLFDVVIIDEASQAGLEAAFLQFLGNRVVVVGDDKQVSPTVIVDHQKVHQLGHGFLAESPYLATWTDPGRSLFDEAKAKYPDLITLIEHRRCVPDIIGFSNQIAYEPDGIRLIPVREVGSTALDPVVPVFVEEGYVEGSSSSRRNPPEARAIVAAIRECISDPAYDDKTMGVISLLGEPQARLIETMLLEEVGPVEMSRRQLRCGVASAFQGSERHVIFLSMVAATDDDNRFAVQTQDTAIQRYNVATSRAQDQLWVFHSEPLSRLSNPQDLRRQLLDYAYRVRDRAGAGFPNATQGLAPEDELVSPFDSLFEQRVHNRIYERGYAIIPQYESLGYFIDLVVVGRRGKFAIECDGDAWHGQDRYLQDISRQRELERCGWSFFRITESDFIIDPEAALAPLWPLLEALDSDSQLSPERLSPPLTRDSTGDVNQASRPSDSESLEMGLAAADDDVPKEVNAVSPRDGLSMLFAMELDDLELVDPTDLFDPEIAGDVLRVPTDFHLRVVPPEGEVDIATSPDGDEPVPITASSDDLVHLPIVSWHFPYIEWSSSGGEPGLEASTESLAQALASIIAVEGPMLGGRAMRLYLRAIGRARLGKQVERTLDEALTVAEREGLVIADNPTRTRNRTQMTFRTPATSPVILRARGPRELYEIPHNELRESTARVAEETGRSDEDLQRAVLQVYGLQRLEEKASSHLLRIERLPRPASNEVSEPRSP
jgi:very-short-patch-repair endonuclease